jgi:hypothetical protein
LNVLEEVVEQEVGVVEHVLKVQVPHVRVLVSATATYVIPDALGIAVVLLQEGQLGVAGASPLY